MHRHLNLDSEQLYLIVNSWVCFLIQFSEVVRQNTTAIVLGVNILKCILFHATILLQA